VTRRILRTSAGLALAASAALAVAFAPAAGQDPASALKGHNTRAPVDVAADRIEVLDRINRAIFSGNVDVRQADLRLNAARITIAYSSAGGTQIERIDATGGVTVRSPSETARSETAIYDTDERIITMLGNVVLTQGANNLRGGRLVLDLDNGRAVMDGGVPGAPGTSTNPTGRVTGRFTVRQD
jgi:lipopolysaccharide export system protein LptA